MVARFHSVFYSIDLLKTMEEGKAPKKKEKVTKATRGAARRGSKTAGGLRMSGDVEFDCLALDDQRAVDDFIKGMNLDIAESETSRRLKRRRSRHKITSEDISARKDSLFAIATSLERMKAAESPSLRKKVEGLKLVSYFQSEDNSSKGNTYREDLVRNGIESSLWNLMASNIPTSRH
ncbi:hypothetical protein J3458_000197 [Metarhizium acridum]|uniref:uncharacterized protein n=1 Tax=Metarhizium acridum TaxID=92637 RepID=UPI001C6C8FE7|nr:hypothetical protein J3458_000197 [Metarhizium acridum]